MERRNGVEVAVLTALRVASSADEDEVAARTGSGVTEAVDALAALEADGLVRRRSAPPSGWSLTRAGRTEAERRMAGELADPVARAAVETAYEAFLRLNPRLLAACTRWQVRSVDGADVVNDHRDPAHDTAAVAELEAVHEAVVPVLAELGAVVAPFDGYGRRFTHAIGKVRAGEGTWFAHPLVDSFHSVWFELHEHLLASLGLDRSSEARTDQPDGGGSASTRRVGPATGVRTRPSDPQPPVLPPTSQEPT